MEGARSSAQVPCPRFARDHLHLSASLFPSTPQYWDLAQISSFMTTEGFLSPGIATLHEFFGWGGLALCLPLSS